MIPVHFFTGPWAPFLNAAAWTALLGIPPLIVLLYFLKLRRMPLEVPSTYLWHRTIEDLHVNSLWQRLRKSLLLFLQLLVLLLFLIACLRPGWRGVKLEGERFIFVIDNSASMLATDVAPTRLDLAKKRAGEMIDQMKSGEVGMIISFSDGSHIVQSYTDNRSLLRRKLKSIQPTNHTSNLREVLIAADGLANPGRMSADVTDIQVADPLPATLYIFSDGGFPVVSDFSLGNLDAKYVPVGELEPANNVAITAFSSNRNPEKPDQQQAFARLESFSPEEKIVDVALYLNDELKDADKVKVSAAQFKTRDVDGYEVQFFEQPGSAGVVFELSESELGELGEGRLRLEISVDDDLKIDNVAHAAINRPRQPRVLLITPGNDALKLALMTYEEIELFEVEPDQLENKEDYLDPASAGVYDLIIYDQCAPKQMPQSNTLFIGSRPPLKNWKFGEVTGPPVIIDTDRAHPMMQLIETRNVWIIDAFAVTPSPGGKSLIDSSIGALLAIGPREGFEDAVLGFEIVGRDEDGDLAANTDWPRRLSFPIFVQNAVQYLGGSRGAFAAPNVKPGEAVTLRATVSEIEIESPDRAKSKVTKEGQNEFVYSDTEKCGIYLVREGDDKEVTRRFAVNLFDGRESNTNVERVVPIGDTPVKGEASWTPARTELWKWLLILGLAVVIFEWYIYNRRVYL